MCVNVYAQPLVGRHDGSIWHLVLHIFDGIGACAPATFVGPGGTSVVVFPVGQAPRQGDNQRFTAVRRIACGFYVIPLGVSCCPKTMLCMFAVQAELPHDGIRGAPNSAALLPIRKIHA